MNDALAERLVRDPDGDRLNQRALRRLLVEEVVTRAATGRGGDMVALFGPWGSGKSSTVLVARLELQQRGDAVGEPIVFLDFDAWKYQGAGGLVAPLVTQLARLRASTPSAQALKRILLATALGTVELVGSLLGLTPVKELLSAASSGAEKADELLKAVTDSHTVVREALEEEVKAVLAAKKAKLVVAVIDNLDRCAPDAALGLLESLYVAGHIEGLMVLCVADQQVLMDFITRKYGIESFDGARYLEKMFPDYFRVPDPFVLWHDDRRVTSLENAAKGGDTIASLLVTLLKGAPLLQRQQELLWFVFSQATALRNPRRIKRIVRRLLRLRGDDESLFDERERFEAVLVLVVLCDLWPKVAHYRSTVAPETWEAFIDAVAAGAELPKTAPSIDFEFRDFVVQLTNGKATAKFHGGVLRKHTELELATEVIRELGL